jgi:hypothetical protein
MILVHPLRIAFQDVPKVGSTSLFEWLHGIVFRRPYTRLKSMPYIHQWFAEQQTDIISNVANSGDAVPRRYFSFCLTRDPVKRFLSAYSNRVQHHRELALSHPAGLNAVKAGLRADPEVNYLIQNLAEYQHVSPAIRHHTRPMTDFLGEDPSIYHRIFDISDMPSLRQALLDHWHDCEIAMDQAAVPAIPRLQTGGPKLGLDVLSYQSIQILAEYYKKDYEVFPTVSREAMVAAWTAAREQVLAGQGTFNGQFVVVTKRKTPDIETHRLLREPTVVGEGDVISVRFSGIILLKADLKDRPDLIFEDASGTGMLQWQASPRVATQYPQNLHAKEARFVADGLSLAPGRPIQIFLKASGGRRALALKVELRSKTGAEEIAH